MNGGTMILRPDPTMADLYCGDFSSPLATVSVLTTLRTTCCGSMPCAYQHTVLDYTCKMKAVLEPDLLDFMHAVTINVVDNQSLRVTASHQSE